MDAIIAAQQRVMAALAKAGSSTLEDVVLKLAAVVRRAMAAKGFPSLGDLDLLRSVLTDT